MSNAPAAITVEGVGKRYRLGTIGTGTLSHDLNRWWARVRGRPDPFAKIGERNDRATGGTKDYVWALRDVSFGVSRGEVVGIIGANGAGKSTLLKLLCRVTAPSAGRITLQGRIASLLEVGTGFHTELTGRENVYLNGTILGMSHREVDERMDDIMAFAGVGRYADTPIKRYSTGMKVRLAFAVAAHLEPDILIVDEVLAVGDAEFQRKAIGKMKSVADATGRTVLFVSHNMEAVARLCTRGIVLDRGELAFDGPITEAIHRYAALNFGKPELAQLADRTDRKGSGAARFTALVLRDGSGTPIAHASPGQSIALEATVTTAGAGPRRVYAGVGIRDSDGAAVTMLSSWARAQVLDVDDDTRLEFRLPALSLAEGEYLIDLFMEAEGVGNTVLDHIESAGVLRVEGKDFFGSGQVAANYRYRYYQDFDIETR